ncbi:MAG: C40 family peptidase [candidate division KSB1 bacterium]|nr:C40 family peptidase [candidate division KSB1 bacterium]
MRASMRWLAALGLLVGAVSLGFTCRAPRPTLPVEVQTIVDQVKARHCPDKRLELFEVTGWESKGQLVLVGETTSPVAHAELVERLRAAFPRKRLVDRVRVLPDSTVGGSGWAIVNVSVANLRREPLHSAELTNQALLGSVLRLYKKHRDWYFARLEDGYLGWTDDGGLWIVDSLSAADWLAAPRLIVLALETTVYSLPAREAQPVSDAVAGNILRHLRTQSGWYEVAFPDGRRGWIHSDDAKPLEDFLKHASPNPEAIVRTAMRLLGRPYLWGGTSPKGLDCSGFACTVFRLNGVLLPRDANMQAMVGEEVPLDSSLSSAQPGDLLFFGPNPGRITHVGIYLGAGQFIHSDSHVRVQSLRPGEPGFSAYRYQNLRRAKRVLSRLVRDPVTGWYRVKD